MSETVQALVGSIVKGDAVEIDSSFNAAMAEKVSARLEAMRQDVAQNMFKTPQVETQEAATDEV